MTKTTVSRESSGAFCQQNDIHLPPTGSGSLDGLRFAAKDVMDIAGSVTGFGQPDWLASHSMAHEHAEIVSRLLSAGAELAGKTQTDELSYSLTGENVHYGTPLNPMAPDRVCGGSSSGSASAVASDLVDFALGTDCAGSVRLPASYCGLYGMRPSHNHVSAQGVIPFAPSFDTVGWLARDAATLQRAGEVLLDGQTDRPPNSPPTGQTNGPTNRPQRLLVAKDAFELVDTAVRDVLMPVVDSVATHIPQRVEVVVSEPGLESWMDCFRIIQGYEIWRSLGQWIEQNNPTLGPGIDDRVEAASKVTEEAFRTATAFRQQQIASLEALIKPGDILCLPTSPRAAPLKDTATSTVEVTYRYQAICLLSIAGLGGLPEISAPMAKLDGLPLGLSFVSAKGCDRDLLDFVYKYCPATS